ncbi:MAG TPA: DUF1028 domain-containing protein [Solirubrobacteraceae bacterium]|nr:DUF1028 domain-containing protein [Solirubrobacteraceae bacterium]
MTYSLVAREPDTGRLGVAVQSHWFSVGSVVSWAQPGVGAVATQSVAEITYGPRGLELMAAGASAQDALERLTGEDPGASVRQVAMVDGTGQVAVHTGADCVQAAGHVTGHQVSCQANMMRSDRVWPAMLEAFQAAEGELAWRLLAALEAAEAAGGDTRGKQSAALLVVPPEGESWRRQVSLRVEDHPEPLPELRRLLGLHAAYDLAGQADELSAAGRHQEAAQLYQQAAELQPGNHELCFWAGLGAAQAGDADRGLADVRAAIAAHAGWRLMLERLPEALAPTAPVVLARLRESE